MAQKPLDETDPTAFLGVRLPSRMVKRLKAEAKQAGTTLSAHVRRLFEGKDDALNATGPAQPEPRESAPATEKGKDAIRIHKARLDKLFEHRVNEEVRRRIEAADDFARKELARLRQENLVFTRMIGERGVFTRAEYKQLLMCVHPDSSASVAVRNKLTDLIVKSERRLVKAEPPAKAKKK